MAEDSQPALHPERIREALRVLKADRVKPEVELFERVYQTAIAALELVRKGQLAVGLTGDVADAGKAALHLIATIQKIGR